MPEKRFSEREAPRCFVDTQANLLKLRVHPADVHDRRAAEPFLDAAAQPFPSIHHFWADTAYQGLKTCLLASLGWSLTVTKHC